MANRLKSAGIDLDSIFQSYISWDIVQSKTTNIQNGGTDIKLRYAGRDNKAGNAASNVNITSSAGALTSLFNKSGATYDVTISGTVTFNGAGQAPTITHSPSNTPTQATLNPTTKTNAGSYTITGNASTGFAVTLPGNYAAGTYSGTFTISQATISGTAVNASATYNGASQSGVVITNVLPAAATYSGSLSASGTNAGTYTSSITGTVNYTGTVNGGIFTINKQNPTIVTEIYYFGSFFYQVQVRVIGALAGAAGIQYSDDAGGFIAGLTTSPQDAGGAYFYFTIYNWNTTSTTNFNAASGNISSP